MAFASGVGNAACEQKLVSEATLHITPDGQVYMPAKVAGRDVYFRLSIGSGLPFVFETSAMELGLELKRRKGVDDLRFGGVSMPNYVMLEETDIGGFKLLARAAVVRPESVEPEQRDMAGIPILGSMGSTLFQNVDAEIHLAERKLKLFRPFRCRSVSPVYWGGDIAALPLRYDAAGALVVTLELDGKRVEAGLLSGENISTIDSNATRKFFGFDETSEGVEVVQHDEGSPRSVFHAMSLTGRGLGIGDAKIRLRPGSSRCELTGRSLGYGAIGYSNCINVVPFQLGTDLLSQLRIYISRERKTVFATLSGAQPTQFGTATIRPTQ